MWRPAIRAVLSGEASVNQVNTAKVLDKHIENNIEFPRIIQYRLDICSADRDSANLPIPASELVGLVVGNADDSVADQLLERAITDLLAERERRA